MIPLDAGADPSLEHRLPWHERELTTFLDERIAAARQVHPPLQIAIDNDPAPCLSEGLAELALKLTTDTQQLPALEHLNRANAKPHPIARAVRQLLLDQPLPPRGQSGVHLAAKPGFANRVRRVRRELAVKPGRRIRIPQV